MARDDNQHLRELPSHAFVVQPVPAEFQQFAIEVVLPTIAFKGYKRHEKRTLAMHALHKLVVAGLTEACVADGRDVGCAGAKLRIQVWDAIVAAGYATQCVGSEKSGKVTRYYATGILLDAREQWKLQDLMDTKLQRNTQLPKPTPLALVYLHTGRIDLGTGRVLPEEQQRQPMAFPNGPGADYFRGIEDLIDEINANNLSHSWQAFRPDAVTGKVRSVPVDPSLRQIHVGEFFRAVRLYTGGPFAGQNLPKAVRRTVLIDGVPVAELDFKALAIRMLYHHCREAPGEGDLYHPELVFPRFYNMANVAAPRRPLVRGLVKKATNICLNTASRKAANSAVARELVASEHSEFLLKLIRNTERMSLTEIVDRILAVHPASVTGKFFTEYGLELMTCDGGIMLHIMQEFLLEERPALAIHDSLVVRQCDREFARDTMTSQYYKFIRQLPEIADVY